MFTLKALITLWMFCAMSAAALAQNLIRNPGNELPLVGGAIAEWYPDHGTPFTQRSLDPLAFEGIYYFASGTGDVDEGLSQQISVNSYSSEIDSGALWLHLSGRVRGANEFPADEATIALIFFDASNNRLGNYFGASAQSPNGWQLVTADLQPPVNTRIVQVTLASHRVTGLTNDAYFDDLGLVASVPEAASVSLVLSGLLVVILRVRKSRRTRSGWGQTGA